MTARTSPRPSVRPSPSPTRKSLGSPACLTAMASPPPTGSVRAPKKATTPIRTSLTFNDLMDEDEVYEGFLGGTWAPYNVVSAPRRTSSTLPRGITYEFVPLYAPTRADLTACNSGTAPGRRSQASTWSSPATATSGRGAPCWRCSPTTCLAENATGESDDDVEKMNLRRHKSVDKRGRTVDEGGNADEANLTSNVPAWDGSQATPSTSLHRRAPQHGLW